MKFNSSDEKTSLKKNQQTNRYFETLCRAKNRDSETPAQKKPLKKRDRETSEIGLKFCETQSFLRTVRHPLIRIDSYDFISSQFQSRLGRSIKHSTQCFQTPSNSSKILFSLFSVKGNEFKQSFVLYILHTILETQQKLLAFVSKYLSKHLCPDDLKHNQYCRELQQQI